MRQVRRIDQDWVFWLTLLLGAFFLLPTLWFKFTMDQALCTYSAWLWKHYHLPPYLGVWDLSFPGIFLWHRLILEIFGESIFGFRLFDFLIQLSSIAMIYYLTQKLSGSRSAGFLAGVFYSIYYAGLGSLETGEREGYIFWILLVALIFGLKTQNRKWLRQALIGFLLGFAFLLKPTYGLSWLVFGIWFLAESRKEKAKLILSQLMVFGFSCLIPALLVIFYYWRLGHLNDLFEATILYNLEVYTGSATAQLSPFQSPGLLFSIVHQDYMEQSLIIFSGVMMILFQIFNRALVKDQKLFWGLVSLLLVSFFSYWLQAKYFPYHLIPFLGFLTIFCGAFLAWIIDQLQGPTPTLRERLIAGIFYLALFMMMISGGNSQWIIYFANESFRSFDKVYSSGESFDAQYYQAAKALEPLLRSEKEIGYFGWHPLLPYLLKKKLPSRFCNVFHLLIRKKDGSLSQLEKKWIQEYTQDVIRAKPRFFLVADYVPGWNVFNLKSPSLKQAMHEEFPELKAFLEENYKLHLKNSLLEVYIYYGE